jgi:EAL domain-containing protein (putative c-di-GMP-specific phosphodiesterase class I)/GGDEF domain-containing protein
MTNQSSVPDGLSSESEFMEAVAIELIDRTRRPGVFAVLRIRINSHMAVGNLIAGDGAEDSLLLLSVDRLRHCLRASDMVAKEKPGTVLILLRDLHGEEDLEMICERIIRAGKRPFEVVGMEIYSGFIVGAALDSIESLDAATLRRNAAAAMYRPICSGEDGFELFTPDLIEKHSDPVEIEQYLRDALENNLLELEFQPQYLKDGSLIGAETLMRLQTPNGRWLEERDFVPWLEDRELIRKMGRRTLNKVFVQAQDWLERGVPIASLSLNVTTSQLFDKDFTAALDELSSETGVPGGLIELTVSESTITTNLAVATETMKKLANIGFRFALSGYGLSPFPTSYLQRLPIETLQVSCTFGVGRYIDSHYVIEAVISRGHRFGFRIAAKDIQSRKHRAELREAGCDVFQGPLLSGVLSSGEMESVLLRSVLKAAV